MLQALNLPVSQEQLDGIAKLEKNFVRENVIPTLKKEIEPFLSDIRSKFKMNVSFSPEKGINIEIEEKQKNDVGTNNANFSDGNSFRDRTRYSIDGGEPLNKRRFVWAVVKDYVDNHPEATLDDLEERFPSSLSHSRMHGVVRSYDEIISKVITQPDLKKRFLLEENEIITLGNGQRIVVYNQWGTTFDSFLKIAKELHEVKSFEWQ